MIQIIEEQVKQVLRHSQELYDEDLNINDLFDCWKRGKQHIIDAWGGRLILEIPTKISFPLTNEMRQSRINNFLDYICTTYHEYDLVDFIMVNRDNFYDNKVNQEYETRSKKIIPKNTKLIKAFKFFELGDTALREVQDRASRLIQEDKIEGNLCLSVHPLDYLSLSENTYHWRSCHSLDGCYRAGNLSYMADNCTIVCYLKSENQCKLPNFPQNVLWNSKKWRTLVYMNEDFTYGVSGKAYPFNSTVGVSYVLKELIQSFSKNIDEYSIFSPTDGADSDIVKSKIYDCSDLHYNDVLRSQVGNLLVIKKNTEEELKNIYVGYDVNCIRCGSEDITSNSDTMLCDHCVDETGYDTNYVICTMCGSRVSIYDTVYVEYFGEVCQHCANTVCSTCDHCGDIYHNSNMIYLPKADRLICENCYREGVV